MSASKNRPPKLGRGLSSLMSTPVKITPDPAEESQIPDIQEDTENSAADAAPGDEQDDNNNSHNIATPPAAAPPAPKAASEIDQAAPANTAGSDKPAQATTAPAPAGAAASAQGAPPAKPAPARPNGRGYTPSTPPPGSPAPPATSPAPPARSTPTGSSAPSPASSATPGPASSAPSGGAPYEESGGSADATEPGGNGSATGSTGGGGDPSGPGLVYLPVESLRPNRHQPRQKFDESSLNRLAASIKSEGMMQPIIARPAPGSPAPGSAPAPGSSLAESPGVAPARYEIVAGERRWRAAQIARISRVPVIVRDLSDRQLAEWSLIENLQREDLNPIEKAEAFHRLVDRFGLSHEETGARVGLDRSSISNHLRILALCEPVRELIREDLLSMGQGRALLGLSDEAQQRMLAERAVRQGLSVREVEAEVRKLTDLPSATGRTPASGQRAPYLVDLEKQIAQQLGTKVAIRPGRKKGTGTLSIEFYTLDQFDTLVGKLGVKMD